MQETISISVPEEVTSALDEISREEGLTRNDVVRRALRDYLFVHKFRRIRARLMSQAQAQGIFTDDDVFRHVS